MILDVRSQDSDFDKLRICSIIFTRVYVLLLLHQMDEKNTLRKSHIFICIYRHGITLNRLHLYNLMSLVSNDDK